MYMQYTRRILGVMCLFAVLAFAFAACGSDDDPVPGGNSSIGNNSSNGNSSASSGADTWTNVTSLLQVNGTWKTTYSQATNAAGFTIGAEVEITLIIAANNATAGTASGTTKTTITYSGDNINIYWPYLKEAYSAEDGWIANDAAHSVTMTESIPSEAITLSDLDGTQINQNGTKMKQPADEDTPEMILIKQS
jgi:hypothetical protein